MQTITDIYNAPASAESQMLVISETKLKKSAPRAIG